jgi:magnesium-transporting ATPase (P-type)
MSEHERTDLFRLRLDEMGRHPLLTKQDEIALSHAYEAGLPGLTIAGPPRDGEEAVSKVASPAPPAWSQRPPLDLAAAAYKPVSVVLQKLGSSPVGLTSDQVASRLATVGPNVLASHKVTALGVLGRQLRNPLLILLLAAAGVSAATGDPTDGAIIAAIVVLAWGHL